MYVYEKATRFTAMEPLPREMANTAILIPDRGERGCSLTVDTFPEACSLRDSASCRSYLQLQKPLRWMFDIARENPHTARHVGDV